jgi:hypothetical protein
MSAVPPELSVVQLAHAWLSGVEFQEHRDVRLDGLAYRVSHELESDVTLEGALCHLRVMIAWFEGDVEVEGPFALSLRVSGRVEWIEERPDEETVRAWLAYSGPYLLWPYVRSFASLITGSSSYPPLTIFTLAVPRVMFDESAVMPLLKDEDAGG